MEEGEKVGMYVFSPFLFLVNSHQLSFEVVGEGRLRTKNYVDVFGLVHIVVGMASLVKLV